jgi:hypothetical protein
MNQVKPSQNYINQDRASVLLEKWSPVLEYSSDNVQAITDDHTRLNTAILLENQEQWCLNEGNTAGGQGSAFGTVGGTPATTQFSQDNYAAGDARLPKILIPMIRRTFPELITNEIVGVQPMSGPVGLAFALRYKYDSAALGAQTVAHPNLDGSMADAATAGGGTANPNTSGAELGYNNLDSRFTGVASTGASALTGGSAGTTASGFNGLNVDSGVAQLLANYELTSAIPQVTVSFEKTAVEAGTRRLAARWSVELEQDVKNMNGIDIDTEVTNAMSYEIQAEIDREMLMRMVQVAINGNRVSVWDASSADARWSAERNRTLYTHLVVQANRIAVRNRRGAANFIVATPKVCAILEMLPEFQWMSVNGNVNTQPVGVARVGNLGGRFNVYRDTRTEAQFLDGNVDGANGTGRNELNYALLGYKGPEFYDTGIIYCPYIPVMVQRTIGPNDFSPRVGLLTRYGVVDHIFGADLYYHLVLVNSINDGESWSNPSTPVGFMSNV